MMERKGRMNITADDRQWFKLHPGRLHRCRLATSAEVEWMRANGVNVGQALDREDLRFVLCIARLRGNNIERIFVAIAALGDMSEDLCHTEWFDCESMLTLAPIERPTQ
jgi:hypothetical protein